MQTAGPIGPVTYTGSFANDLFDGVGHLYCKQFTTLGRATFKEDKLHGMVVRQKFKAPLFMRKGIVKEGNWVNGVSTDDKTRTWSAIMSLFR